MNKIATYDSINQKLQYSGSLTGNKCSTKKKCIEDFPVDESLLTSYTTNQLVKLSDIERPQNENAWIDAIHNYASQNGYTFTIGKNSESTDPNRDLVVCFYSGGTGRVAKVTSTGQITLHPTTYSVDGPKSVVMGPGEKFIVVQSGRSGTSKAYGGTFGLTDNEWTNTSIKWWSLNGFVYNDVAYGIGNQTYNSTLGLNLNTGAKQEYNSGSYPNYAGTLFVVKVKDGIYYGVYRANEYSNSKNSGILKADSPFVINTKINNTGTPPCYIGNDFGGINIVNEGVYSYTNCCMMPYMTNTNGNHPVYLSTGEINLNVTLGSYPNPFEYRNHAYYVANSNTITEITDYSCDDLFGSKYVNI